MAARLLPQNPLQRLLWWRWLRVQPLGRGRLLRRHQGLAVQLSPVPRLDRAHCAGTKLARRLVETIQLEKDSSGPPSSVATAGEAVVLCVRLARHVVLARRVLRE